MSVQAMTAASTRARMLFSNLGCFKLPTDLLLDVVKILPPQQSLFSFFFFIQTAFALLLGQGIDPVNHFFCDHERSSPLLFKFKILLPFHPIILCRTAEKILIS